MTATSPGTDRRTAAQDPGRLDRLYDLVGVTTNRPTGRPGYAVGVLGLPTLNRRRWEHALSSLEAVVEPRTGTHTVAIVTADGGDPAVAAEICAARFDLDHLLVPATEGQGNPWRAILAAGLDHLVAYRTAGGPDPTTVELLDRARAEGIEVSVVEV
jgi:hypothetical protein